MYLWIFLWKIKGHMSRVGKGWFQSINIAVTSDLNDLYILGDLACHAPPVCVFFLFSFPRKCHWISADGVVTGANRVVGWAYTMREGWRTMHMWTLLYYIWQRQLLSDVSPQCVSESVKFTLFPTRGNACTHRRNKSKRCWDELEDIISLMRPSRGIMVACVERIFSVGIICQCSQKFSSQECISYYL